MFQCAKLFSIMQLFYGKKEYNYGQNNESEIKKDYKNSFYNKNIL